MGTSFVGRQPIFGADLDVYGYELLFRSSAENSAAFTDGDQATATVLTNAFTELGLDTIVGTKRAFVNLTRNVLLNMDLFCLPPDRVVLEILESVEPDEPVLAAISELAAAGYMIALDDLVYRPELEPLIGLIDIAKIEYPQIPTEDLPNHIAILRELGVRKILAEKLETQEDFELCKSLGCDLFQGYFFCRPQVLSQPNVPTNIASVIRLVTELQNSEITTSQVESVIQTDANLAYKLLRFVNSVSGVGGNKIESIKHATALMGLQRLRSLASMMLLTSMDLRKPQELINIALTRAKMCELIAEEMGDERPDRLYTLGLMSVMDAMLDMSMEEVIKLLPLATDINDALLNRTGKMGDVLACVIDFEAGKPRATANLTGSQVEDAYLTALRWTTECAQAV